MKKIILIILISSIYNYCGESPIDKKLDTEKTSKSIELPKHQIAAKTSLAPKDGWRIQINVNDPKLSKEQCIALINKYREQAGTEGQVSVRKPSKMLKGTMQPWCVDNMDGEGISFNDNLFE